MHFAYEFVPHAMDKIQEYIDYIFHHVWCAAPTFGPYDKRLYANHAELADIVNEWFYLQQRYKSVKFFTDHIEGIYRLFSTLTDRQIDQMRQWYAGNNNIENACGDLSTNIVRYNDLQKQNPELAEKLYSFFHNLYRYLSAAALTKKTGTTLNAHYTDFLKVNRKRKCPFCGLNRIKGKYRSKRDAYDHYLPKSVYPFNSVNFHNLFPACNECNSTCKQGKDPLYSTKTDNRRKAFYPFSKSIPKVSISIELSVNDWEKITPSNITIIYDAPGYTEEVSTWRELYDIDERYSSLCTSEEDGKEWLVQIYDEWRNNGKTPQEYLATLSRQTATSPLHEANFLKKAFLDACDNAGLFAD